MAHKTGLRVARSARWDGYRCQWTQSFPDGYTRQAGPALYSGSAGTALFLAELYARTNCGEAKRAARGAVLHALSEISDLPSNASGLFSGRIGILVAALRTSHALGDSSLEDQAIDLVLGVIDIAYRSEKYDLLEGTAGIVIGILALAKSVPTLGAIAGVFGERLIAMADRGAIGWSWNSGQTALPLVGLAHGASGAAYALLELYRSTGTMRFRVGAEQAMAFERAHADPGNGIWPDFRHPIADAYIRRGDVDGLHRAKDAGLIPSWRPGVMNAWCHGAPGIALVRTRASEILGQTIYADEAKAAFSATVRELNAREDRPFRSIADASLCHGMAGLAEALRVGSMKLDIAHWHTRSEEAIARTWHAVVAAYDAVPPLDVGLMMGESGLGVALMAHSDRAPDSILLL